MSQIELQQDFDFSQDAHKGILHRDLTQLARSISNLRAEIKGLREDPLESPVFPATVFLVPDTTNASNTWLGVGADGMSLAGNQSSVELDEGWVADTYAIVGEEARGMFRGAPVTGGSSTPAVSLAFYGQVPRGITRWKPNAIEFDWRAHLSSTGTGNVGLTAASVYVANTVVNTTSSFTAVSSSTLDTGWTRTVLAQGEDMGEGYSIVPGSPILVQMTLSCGVVDQGDVYVGNLNFNWT